MSEIAWMIPLVLIVPVLLIQSLTLTVCFDEGPRAKLDYSFWQFTLNVKNKKRKKKTSVLLMIQPTKRFLNYVVKHTEIEFDKFILKLPNASPSKFSVNYRNIFSLFSILTAYLSNNAKKLTVNENSIAIISGAGEKTKAVAEASFTCPLIYFLNGLTLFLVSLIKGKLLQKKHLRYRRKAQ